MITVFLPFSTSENNKDTVDILLKNKAVSQIYLLVTSGHLDMPDLQEGLLKGCGFLKVDDLTSTRTIKTIIRVKSVCC